jgi:hypothetical protein
MQYRSDGYCCYRLSIAHHHDRTLVEPQSGSQRKANAEDLIWSGMPMTPARLVPRWK